MNLQQLRSVRELVRQDLSLTRAALALNISQPGMSRNIRLAEEALGVALFLREKNRFAGLTSAGKALLPLAARALEAVDDLGRLAGQFAAGDTGSLTIATAHTHARYSLPPVIEKFIESYPRIELRLRQGHLPQIASWLSKGEADLSISTRPVGEFPELVFLPCYEQHRVVITRPGHELLQKRRLSLEDLARFPIITYGQEFSARAQIRQAFERRRLTPNIVLSATDADIMKTYVLCGLGVAIVADAAFDETRDSGLRAIDARHLFPSNGVFVGLRKGATPATYAAHLIRLFAPHLDWKAIARDLSGTSPRDHATATAAKHAIRP
jgi:LysR family transcriptional regulator, cys regulon transcriptional activator